VSGAHPEAFSIDFLTRDRFLTALPVNTQVSADTIIVIITVTWVRQRFAHEDTSLFRVSQTQLKHIWRAG